MTWYASCEGTPAMKRGPLELTQLSFEQAVERLQQALEEAGFARVLELDADLVRYVQVQTGLAAERCTVLMATGSNHPETPRLQTQALVLETGSGQVFFRLSDPTAEVAKTSCPAVRRIARSTWTALERVIERLTAPTRRPAVA